jgi:hypothetical protein
VSQYIEVEYLNKLVNFIGLYLSMKAAYFIREAKFLALEAPETFSMCIPFLAQFAIANAPITVFKGGTM